MEKVISRLVDHTPDPTIGKVQIIIIIIEHPEIKPMERSIRPYFALVVILVIVWGCSLYSTAISSQRAQYLPKRVAIALTYLVLVIIWGCSLWSSQPDGDRL